MHLDYQTKTELISYWGLYTQAERAIARQILSGEDIAAWPQVYFNADTGKPYLPHHDAEAEAVYWECGGDYPTYELFRGGEGGGKSVAGIIKALERVRRGMDGIMVSPDFEHFRRSLWPEFRRWCPWHMVVEGQQHRQERAWTPFRPVEMVFRSEAGQPEYATIVMSGIKEAGKLEGPNVNWAMIDEARHLKTAAALKVLSGRIRISGPRQEPPQLWVTTTPKKHWLYDYFGPAQGDEDDHADLKANLRDVVLLTRDNIVNLDPDYLEHRAQTLNESERRVLLEAAWEDIDDPDRFLPSMIWWDACLADLAPLRADEALFLGVDAATDDDCFAIVGVTRDGQDNVQVRYFRAWTPGDGGLDFQGPEEEIRRLCANFTVAQIAYDKYQLHDMMTRLGAHEGLAWCKTFDQGVKRLTADKQLFDVIMQRRLAHDGNAELRRHIDNADRKADADHRKLRIVKRNASQKVDGAVALSMAVHECLRLEWT